MSDGTATRKGRVRGGDGRLDSWKEVAAYLRSSVRSVQRWEKEEGLPVHRHHHAKLGSIYAFERELDEWRERRSDAGAAAPSPEAREAPAGEWTAELAAVRRKLSEVPDLTADEVPALFGEAPGVGRAAELGEMRAAFEEVAQAGSLVLCVAGEAGIGKTTLLRDFLAGLVGRRAPLAIAHGQCSQRLAGNEAYLPVLEALESLLRLPDGDLIGRLMRLVAPTWYVQIAPLWATTDPTYGRVIEDAKTASRERMMRELSAFLHELSATRPIVVLLDDVHWADESTVEIVAYLARSAASMRVLIVAAYRASELLLAEHPFLEVKRDLQSRGLCREISVELLGLADTAEYLDSAYAGHRFPPTLATSVHGRTGGNPLFMVDLLRHMGRAGIVVERDGAWQLSRDLEAAAAELPESVRSMIERKIAQLDDDAKRLLIAAAVQGSEFDSAVIADATGTTAARVEEALRDLDRVHAFIRLLRESEMPDGTLSLRYAFVHVLYQNALYETLTPSGRSTLSLAVAQSLLERYQGEHSLVAVDLACLFETARDYGAAADYFLVAADSALAIHAHSEAVALAGRAIGNAEQLAGSEGLRRKQAAAFQRVRAYFNHALFEESVTASRFAEEVATHAGDIDAVVEAVCGIANGLFYLKRLDASLSEGARALDLARERGSAAAVANAEAALARVRLAHGELDDGIALFDRAIPVLLAEESSLQAIDAVGFRILTHAWRLEYAEVEEGARWWSQEARHHGLQLGQIHFYRGMALANSGRISQAMAVLREGIASAELHGDVYHICRLPNTLGFAYRLAGDRERALELDLESRDLARELGFEEAEANAHVNLANDYLYLGEHERAFDHLQQAERIFRDDVWFRWRYNIRVQLEKSAYWIHRGDLPVAASCAAAAYQLAERVLARKHMAGARKLAGDIAALEDRLEQAREEYRGALSILDGHPCPSLEWRVNVALAEIAAKLGDGDAADRARRRGRELVAALADSIDDDGLRRGFLASPEVERT